MRFLCGCRDHVPLSQSFLPFYFSMMRPAWDRGK
jgi:hypothetical protein